LQPLNKELEMAHDDTYIIGVPIEPRDLHPQRSLTRTGRLFQAFRRRRRRLATQRIFGRRQDERPSFPAFDLGSYAGECVAEEAFDGDLTIDRISGSCKITLESRHGSITIRHKVEQGARAQLKAAKAVTIGDGIDQHAIVHIAAGGNVTIGQSISEGSQARITTFAGQIDIAMKVDNHSQANLTAVAVHIGQGIGPHSAAIITAQGDVTIDGSIIRHATADIISLKGAISIAQAIEDNVSALLTAGKTVHVGEKVDQRSEVTVLAQDDVIIGDKIGCDSVAKITSINGSISIGQGLGRGASATLIARNGSINLGGSVDEDAILNWNAQRFNCPQQGAPLAARSRGADPRVS
jgi:hypothetical protein